MIAQLLCQLLAQTLLKQRLMAGAVTGSVVVSDADGNDVATGNVTDGTFSLTLPISELDEVLTFIVTGSYTDEVSGDTVNLSSANPLALIMAANQFTAGDTGNAPVSPESTVIHHLVRQHNMTMTQATAAFQNAFGYQPNMAAVLFDPSTTDSATAAARPQADRDAAFHAGVFSQLANDLNLSGDDIAAMLAALADDLSDDSLDGVDGTNAAVMIGNAAVNLKTLHETNPLSARLLAAHGGFAGSSNNTAGLSAPITGLPAIAYDLQGTSKTITTASGRMLTVTLDSAVNVPIMSGFSTSRVKHKITLTDAATGDPIDLNSDTHFKQVSQHPYMHMLSGHDHTTPHGHDADLSEAASGIYYLDSYYVMASQMGMGDSGMPMGVWDYPVNISNPATTDDVVTTSVMFHPQVKMPMGGNTFFSKVSNVNHQWTTMMAMTQPRPYRVWLHEVSNNSNSTHDLSVFVSTQDIGNMSMGSMSGGHSMMTFPAAYTGQMLHGSANDMGMRPDVTLASVTLDVSLDAGATWQSMTEDNTNHGLFTITGLVGLQTTQQNTVSFRLTVNDGTASVMTTAGGDDAALIFTAP